MFKSCEMHVLPDSEIKKKTAWISPSGHFSHSSLSQTITQQQEPELQQQRYQQEQL